MKPQKAKLRSEADKLWYEAILKMANYKCEVCGKKAIQAHHFVPKSLSNALRFQLINGVALCIQCHFSHHHRGDPKIHAEIIKKRGKRWLNKVEKIRKETIKTSLKWYEEQIERLAARELRNDPLDLD